MAAAGGRSWLGSPVGVGHRPGRHRLSGGSARQLAGRKGCDGRLAHECRNTGTPPLPPSSTPAIPLPQIPLPNTAVSPEDGDTRGQPDHPFSFAPAARKRFEISALYSRFPRCDPGPVALLRLRRCRLQRPRTCDEARNSQRPGSDAAAAAGTAALRWGCGSAALCSPYLCGPRNLACLNRHGLARIYHAHFVAQASKPAVARVSKPAARSARPTPCRLGSRRHSRFGNLRYKGGRPATPPGP